MSAHYVEHGELTYEFPGLLVKILQLSLCLVYYFSCIPDNRYSSAINGLEGIADIWILFQYFSHSFVVLSWSPLSDLSVFEIICLKGTQIFKCLNQIQSFDFLFGRFMSSVLCPLTSGIDKR